MNGTGPGGATITDTHAFVPRLGAVWDVKGNGQYQVSGSYAQYAGKYNDGQAAQGTVVGNPSLVEGFYTGPAGEGYGFAPGFDPKNYETFAVNFPLANVFYPDSVSAPITSEFTVSVGGKLTPTFNAAATFIYRNTKNFIEDFTNNPTASGKTDVVYQGVDYGRSTTSTSRTPTSPAESTKRSSSKRATPESRTSSCRRTTRTC